MKPKFKRFQLWVHHHYLQIRRWTFIIVAIVLLVFSAVSISNQNRLISQIKELSKQNRILNQQSKDIGEQNQSIAVQNRAYARCIANIFAKYTRDTMPIEIINLDTCNFESLPKAINNPPTGTAIPPKTTQASSSPQPESKPATSDTATTQTPPTPPSPQSCIIDFLGLRLVYQ